MYDKCVQWKPPLKLRICGALRLHDMYKEDIPGCTLYSLPTYSAKGRSENTDMVLISEICENLSAEMKCRKDWIF